MLHCLEGMVLSKTPSDLVISCGGVGFRVMIPSSVYAHLPDAGESGVIYTYLNVKEDGMDLYGFHTEEQCSIFKLLISVSGVGPKAALAILSAFNAEDISLAIAAGDYKMFTAVSGVGSKLAQRIVLELRDRASDIIVQAGAAASRGMLNAAQGTTSEAVSALVSLGFKQGEAYAEIAKLPHDMTVEDMISSALRSLGSR